MRLGRYTLYEQIASGGMATVHFARMTGEAGFSRTVAVKRMHSHLAKDPQFARMFMDEALLAARIQHPNVVATLDVEQLPSELIVVMEYVHGEALSRLIRVAAAEMERIPVATACAIAVNVLNGLHAAHEARDEHGVPLEIVHRDISPSNILVGADGVARVIDFGVAKARGRLHTTLDGRVKGTLGYMPPEQLKGARIDRRADIYAVGVVLWELLTLVRLFVSDSDVATLEKSLQRKVEPPSAFAADVPRELDDVVMRALSRDPSGRFDTAKQMAAALEQAVPLASQSEVGELVEKLAHAALAERAMMLASVGHTSTEVTPTPLPARRWPWFAAGAAVLTAVFVVGIRHATRASEPPAPIASAAPTPSTTASEALASPLTTPIAPASTPAGSPHSPTVRHHASRCDPPFTVGADGIRHYKLECLPNH